ncbi:hypothetical protein pb186bvf_003095 [Paramecium bursaria]
MIFNNASILQEHVGLISLQFLLKKQHNFFKFKTRLQFQLLSKIFLSKSHILLKYKLKNILFGEIYQFHKFINLVQWLYLSEKLISYNTILQRRIIQNQKQHQKR